MAIDKELEQNFFDSLGKRFKDDIAFRTYEKGKRIGTIEELKKIKDEMIQERDSVDLSCADSFNWNIRLIDKHIEELKGDKE